MLTTNQKGAIAERAVSKAALEAGWDVYRPLAEGGRYDLVFDMGVRLARVQCKWAPVRGDVVVVRSYSSRRARSGLVRRTYVAGEFDYVAVYAHVLDRCFLVPWAEIDGRTQLHLRLGPTRNNQRQGVRAATDFLFAATLPQTRLGP